ncbi:MAG: anthranilate synthase component I family protein [Synergistaceae bacterium]|nr:anthranilate synthase component I family protein [Synergistaceae bacterium]
MELFADIKTPVEVFRTLKDRGREAYILESAASGESWGRYTFLGSAPVLEVSGREGRVIVKYRGVEDILPGDAHSALKEFVGSYRSPRIAYMPPFTGGFVGYFAYEYIRHTEPTLKLTDSDSVGFDDFRLMLFDRVIAFDNFRQKIILTVNIPTNELEKSYIDGVAALKDMENLVKSNISERVQESSASARFTTSFTKEAFCAAVEKAKHHIHEGDIFQCVPSIRFKSPYSGDLLQPYRILRTTNPSAYMFNVCFSDMEVAGASPETLVSLKNGVISTYPLAGTCRRTDDDEETKTLIEALTHDEKELAEHDMLVDLGRNDLGKICRFGSVRVDEYRSVKKLSHVCHIASRVTGELKEGYEALDVMAAVLPAGTLSGAPKKRACEIIDDIEEERRGVYGGALGYIDFAGNMDLCIGIRMAVLKDGFVYVQAGAGVVADSVPEREYEECLRKAKAMMEAIREAMKGGSGYDSADRQLRQLYL